MVVYHGTDIDSAYLIKNNILLDIGSKSVDFGPGFYVTTNIEMAKKWAKRKAIVRRKMPVVLIFEYDETASNESVLKLENDLNWGRFIINNRNGYEYIEHMQYKVHNLDAKYPIVYGRIADYDTVGLAQQLLADMQELSSIDEMLNPYYSYQYSFHTKESLKYLSISDKYYDVTNGGVKLW